MNRARPGHTTRLTRPGYLTRLSQGFQRFWNPLPIRMMIVATVCLIGTTVFFRHSNPNERRRLNYCCPNGHELKNTTMEDLYCSSCGKTTNELMSCNMLYKGVCDYATFAICTECQVMSSKRREEANALESAYMKEAIRRCTGYCSNRDLLPGWVAAVDEDGKKIYQKYELKSDGSGKPDLRKPVLKEDGTQEETDITPLDCEAKDDRTKCQKIDVKAKDGSTKISLICTSCKSPWEGVKTKQEHSLYTRYWINKEGKEVPANEEGEISHAKPAGAIRFLQFNILAHGLSDTSSGFAASYKENIREATLQDPPVKDELVSEQVNELLMSGKTTNTGGIIPPPPRFNRIMSIILEQNPDVITLQEVDHHLDLMMPQLEALGYEGIFREKHKSVASKYNGGVNDGVAIYWNTQKIKLAENHLVFSGSLHDHKGKQAKQVAIAVKLQLKTTDQEFLVMTAHVKSGDKPKEVPIKEAQGREVANMMADNHLLLPGWAGPFTIDGKVVYRHSNGSEQEETPLAATQLPVVFACDFNNAPGGHAHVAFYKKLAEKGTVVTSAYGEVLGHLADPTNYDEVVKAEPEFTTDKWRKGGEQKQKIKVTRQTIDYIFHTEEFECSRVLDITPKPGQERCLKCNTVANALNKCPKCGASGDSLAHIPTRNGIEAVHMPGYKYPSDHFMICADLTLSPRK